MLTLRAVPLLAAVAAPRAAIAIDQEDTFEAEVASINPFIVPSTQPPAMAVVLSDALAPD